MIRRGGGNINVVCTADQATGTGGAVTSASRRGTRRTTPAHSGIHQFQLPSSFIRDGRSSARMTVASKMIPPARPIASAFTSYPGLDESTRKANMRIRAALVTSLPVRARPSSIALSVEPVSSYASRMREIMNTS